MTNTLHKEKEKHNALVISYLTLRTAVGLLAISLPVVVVAGISITACSFVIPDSISASYYTNMGDVFICMLASISLFLYSYTGYEAKDNIAGNIACVLGFTVCFCATTHQSYYDHHNFHMRCDCSVIGYIHLAAASSFILTMAYFCIFLFTKTDQTEECMGSRKKLRNIIYYVCGYTMIAALAAMTIYMVATWNSQGPEAGHPIFWGEVICLWAFGIAWFIKGETLFKDTPEHTAAAKHEELA